MELLHGIVNVFTPLNLFFCFLGCVLGTLVGVLPGLGTASTLAILLPLTTYWNPTAAIIMLAGLYYGAQYGGSTTSILVNIPGEAASVVTCLDGFQMTKQGRAGEALWIAAVGSFLAGTVSAVAISFVGPAIALYALKFGPPEYFGLIVLSLTTLVSLSGDSVLRGLSAGIIGISLATVGIALSLSGAAGIGYTAVVVRRARRQQGYAPVLEDWVWHAVLPAIAYLTQMLAAVALPDHPTSAPFWLGGAAVLLLITGIHNAWDAAAYIALASGGTEPR